MECHFSALSISACLIEFTTPIPSLSWQQFYNVFRKAKMVLHVLPTFQTNNLRYTSPECETKALGSKGYNANYVHYTLHLFEKGLKA